MLSLDNSIKKQIGAIAMIDILGYGDIISKNSIDFVKNNIIDTLINSIEKANCIVNRKREKFSHFANNNIKQTALIKYLFFSDTFLIYIENEITDESLINNQKNTLNSLCFALCIILNHSFHQNIALRGAISYGEFYLNKNPLIIIGEVITEIAKLEKSQQWAGVVLSKKLEKLNLCDQFVTNYMVPFKKNNNCTNFFKRTITEFKVINWVSPKTNNFIDANQLINFNKCFDSKKEDVKEKKQNTMKFYELMKT